MKEVVIDLLRRVVTRVMLFVWVVTTLVVAIAGPFGTFEALPFPHRLAYWAGVVGASMVLAILFRILWHLVIRADPEWLEDGLVITSLALVFGPMVAILNMSLWPDAVGIVGWHMISFVTFAIGWGTVGARHLIQAHQENGPNSRRDRLLERIDAPSDARLCRISSDNHHIKITVATGDEFRVLMRLRDAIADIDIEPGFCVHRSHWVALSQIRRVELDEGREIVRLACGSTLPVGPKYRSNLIEAGVLSA